MDTNFSEKLLGVLTKQGQLPFVLIRHLRCGAEWWRSPPHHHHHHHGAPELQTVQAPDICQEIEQL